MLGYRGCRDLVNFILACLIVFVLIILAAAVLPGSKVPEQMSHSENWHIPATWPLVPLESGDVVECAIQRARVAQGLTQRDWVNEACFK